MKAYQSELDQFGFVFNKRIVTSYSQYGDLTAKLMKEKHKDSVVIENQVPYYQ